jgi:hypothetical protein
MLLLWRGKYEKKIYIKKENLKNKYFKDEIDCLTLNL